MFLHNIVIGFPLFIVAYSLIVIAYYSVIYILRKKKKPEAINRVKLFMTAFCVFSAFWLGLTYQPSYGYIPAIGIVFAIMIDIVCIGWLLTFGWRAMLKPVLDATREVGGAPWFIPVIGWWLAFVIVTAHFFLTGAAICECDAVFRPILGQEKMDAIAAMREDDSINRADREEQDYWNSHANTIQD